VDLIVHVDGASRGNPGPAGAGVAIRATDGTLIHEGAYYLGHQTNNAAEYYALIHALQRAARCACDTMTVRSDSELLVRQVTGEYRVKSARLASLFEQVQLLLLRVHCWNIRHIPREQNQRADELANLAIDRRQDVVVFDADGDLHDSPSPDEPRINADPVVEKPPSDPTRTTQPRESIGIATPVAARVALARAPRLGGCPAGQCFGEPFTVETTLPVGLCVHACHALLPTVLAILNTAPDEVAAVPTLTVRCMRPGCGATFHVSPVRGSNGAAQRDETKRGRPPASR
jgi:ribonuclease HI